MATFREKQLEEWLVANWRIQSKNALYAHWPEIAPTFELVGRQIPCAGGIIDLLAFSGRVFYIVELKATVADEKVIEQVVRYQNAIEDAALSAEFDVSLDMGRGYPSGDATRVCPVVIAPDFVAKALRTLNQIGNAALVSFDGDKFAFSSPTYERSQQPRKLQNVLRPYVAGAIGREIGVQMNKVVQSTQTITVCNN